MSTAKKKDSNNLGDIYGNMLNTVKHNIIRESKVKQGEIGDAPLIKGGPQQTAGYMPSKIDRKKMSKKELDENLYHIKDLSYGQGDTEEDAEEYSVKKAKAGKDIGKPGKTFAKIEKTAAKKYGSKKAGERVAGAVLKKLREGSEEEINEETKKIARKSLNNFMSKKSIFDKLYESVFYGDEAAEDMQGMNELEELGIETHEGGEEGDVTITIDRATAEKLLDIIGAAMGQEHDESEVEAEYGGGDEDYEDASDEDEEDFDAGSPFTKAVNTGKNNKVGTVKPVGGAVSYKYTDKVGSDGDLGHAEVNAKKPNMGTNNKVGKLKAGQGAFQQ